MNIYERKQYIAPAVEVSEFDGMQPLCQSPDGNTESYGRGGNYGEDDFE